MIVSDSKENIMRVKRKSYITLLEIVMVVIMIGMITSVIGINMRKSLERGKAFKSEQGSREVYDHLMIQLIEGTTIDNILQNPKEVLSHNDFGKNPDTLMVDGWNELYEIISWEDEFIVYSPKWRKYLEDKKQYDLDRLEKEFPWAFKKSVLEYKDDKNAA